MKLSIVLIFSLLCFSSNTLLAAACCGGGTSNSSLISGDNKAQLSTSISHTQVTVDSVDSDGIWRIADQHQQSDTFKVEGAHIIDDRWQAGASLPIIQREKFHQRKSGLGDLNATLGYEYLTDWDYHPWRPKGIGFLTLTIPMGKTKAESENGGLDSFGQGFWALGVGTHLSKIIGSFDLLSTIDIHRSFAKTVHSSQVDGTLTPGWGGNLSFGLGYNIEKWRIGSTAAWTYEDPISLNSDPGTFERYGTLSLNISYLHNDEWSSTLSYSDQSIIGTPTNTSLGRTVAFLLQRRWSR